MPIPYKTYSEYLSERFPGVGKIQKLGISAGFTCPNRDGTLGTGGCAYCNNSTFSAGNTPSTLIDTCDPSALIVRQLENGKKFFAHKYPSMKYLAYFQSFTNTYDVDQQRLEAMYQAAAKTPDVVGIIIGTRPDCVPEKLLDFLGKMNRNICPVMLEFGAETSHDKTLHLVNRGHTWSQTVHAVMRANAHGLSVGLHFIMGLPGETEDMMLETVRVASLLPVDTFKFHQLQIVKGTKFAAHYRRDPSYFNLFTPEAYADLCRKIINIIGPTGKAIERFVSQSPDDLLIAPRWGLKNYQFTNLLNKIYTASKN